MFNNERKHPADGDSGCFDVFCSLEVREMAKVEGKQEIRAKERKQQLPKMCCSFGFVSRKTLRKIPAAYHRCNFAYLTKIQKRKDMGASNYRNVAILYI